MILAINIGNSSINCGIHSKGSWLRLWRMATGVDRTHDEYELLLLNFISSWGISAEDIGCVVVASVVPGLDEAFHHAIRKLFKTEAVWVSTATPSGIEIAIDNPAELGADLYANAVAAYEKTSRSCIIVDFGTALTFTAMQADARGKNPKILGASIAPGLGSAISSLSSNTAQLPHVSLSPPPRAIGTNTVHSIQSGVVFGYVGLVESMVRRIAGEMSPEPAVIATGGMSRIITPLTGVFTINEPWLTLDGLRILLERNVDGGCP